MGGGGVGGAGKELAVAAGEVDDDGAGVGEEGGKGLSEFDGGEVLGLAFGGGVGGGVEHGLEEGGGDGGSEHKLVN